MLDEKALRRADWQPGARVKLGDGQEWELRRPRIRWVPKRENGGIKTRAHAHELGPECDELIGVFFGDVESEKYNFADARFELVIRLLQANYELSDDDCLGLLWIDEEENADNKEMWTALGSIVAGRSAPKPTPAT